MRAARPRFEDLPATFPVFPLTGALLLPGGKLPLNIFEPRYLAMIEDALGAGRLLGMIQPDPTRPAGDTGPALYRVGCLGRVSSFSETEDGRYLVTLTGLTRFTVVEEVTMVRGYRRVLAAFGGFPEDLAEPPDEEDAPPFDRGRLIAALRGYFLRRGFDANWDSINAMEAEALVVTLAMVCPFEPAAKQALLEAPGLADRARTLQTLLDIDAHSRDEDDATGPGRRPS